MRRVIGTAAVALLALTASAVAQSGEYIDTTAARFGYAVTIPREFTMDGSVSDSTTWTWLPDAAPGGTGETVTPVPALTIWVNRTPVEAKNLAGLYAIGRRNDADAAAGPNPPIRDVTDLAIEGGYGYRYKEVDKTDGTAHHRWIARVFGNGAVYTIALSGPFAQFETWGPAFDQVIAGFRLLPMK